MEYESENLCKKCYIKQYHPNKKDIKKIVLTYDKGECECCHRNDYLVDFFAYEEDY